LLKSGMRPMSKKIIKTLRGGDLKMITEVRSHIIQ